MEIYLNSKPRDYVGSFPSITIHYLEHKKYEAEELKSLILEAVRKKERLEDLFK